MTVSQPPLKTHPLDLPEIRLLVTRYLSNQDCLQCCLVSRDWHRSFLDPIWKELEFSDTCREEGRIPAPSSVRQHGHLVQTLKFLQGIDPKYSSIDFPYLKTLSISGVLCEQESTEAEKDVGDNQVGAIATSLINSNPSLKHLTYTDCPSDCIPFGAISKLENLKRLDLTNCRGYIDWTSALWSICAKLEDLVLDTVALDGLGHLDKKIIFPKIRYLSLNHMYHSSDSDMIDIARRCPSLRKFVVYARRPTFGLLHQALVEGTWPELRIIVLDEHFATSEADIGRLFKAISLPCIEWATRKALFGENAFRVMAERFLTLQRVDLTGCQGVTSAMIQEILCSCPRLTRYRGGRIEMSDIADGLPWVCRSIRRLNVFITRAQPKEAATELKDTEERDEEQENRVQRRVFEQIAQLPCLERLIVGYNSLRYLGPVQPGDLHSGLELKVSKGLDLLGGLKNLQTFRFRGIAQIMEAEDVAWMRDHWKQLEEVTGVFHYKDSEEHERLANILRERCITTLE